MRLAKSIFSFALVGIIFSSCSGLSDLYGSKVKNPYDDFTSTSRYFRASGMGKSPQANVAKRKANMEAKVQLAGQVDVYVKSMTDDYFNQRGDISGGISARSKFENLSREVINTRLLGVRMKGEEVYVSDNGEYTAFVALEMHKKSFYEELEKRIELESGWTDDERQVMLEFIEKEIKKTEEEED